MKRLIFVAENLDELVLDWNNVEFFNVSCPKVGHIEYDRSDNGEKCSVTIVSIAAATIKLKGTLWKEHLAFGQFSTGLSELDWLKQCNISQIGIEDDDDMQTNITYHLAEEQTVTVSVVGDSTEIEIK